MGFPKFLKPKATADLVRIGSPGDGGYVLPERVLKQTKGVIGMGLCDDWTFEKEVASRTGVPIVVFDHSVGLKFWVRRTLGSLYHGVREFNLTKLSRATRFAEYYSYFNSTDRRHVRRAIGRSEHGFVGVKDAMQIAGFDRDILLKMDIEGAEYRVLDQIQDHRECFTAIVMELHEIDIHEATLEAFFSDISKDFALVHFHANNATTWGPDDYSIVVEVTLMHRSLLSDGEELIEHPLPIPGLDAKSMPRASDIKVSFE